MLVEVIKKYYKEGIYSDKMIEIFCKVGRITKEEMAEILNDN